VTSPLRTAIDLARSGSLAQGVAALDHVLAGGLDRSEALAEILRRRPFHGVGNVDRALNIAQGRSESPLESLSLARFAELGFAQPQQQHGILIGRDRYRVDFFWPEVGVVGEADGRLKYSSNEDLWREKRREDAIRREVAGFIRWTWTDAWTSTPLGALLRSAGIPHD
jgi:hypothetical protein